MLMSHEFPTTAQNAHRFLAHHNLEPIPANYMLAWQAVQNPDSAVGRAISQFTEFNARLCQREADRIFQNLLMSTLAGEQYDGERADLRHQALKIAELTVSTANSAKEFALDLSHEAKGLYEASPVASVIIGRLVDRVSKAEGELSAAVMQIETLQQKLDVAKDDAARDALTGLKNRRGIEEDLDLLAQADTPYTIAICDIDNFKSINDRFGHSVGDRVLKAVAGTLQKGCAPYAVGRWGGEEFIVLFPSFRLKHALSFIDDRRAALAARRFRVRETDTVIGRVTFSAGLAQAAGGPNSTIKAINRADAALYRAKSQGRNLALT